MAQEEADPILTVIACASKISGLDWDGSKPEVKNVDRDYLGSVSSDVDGNGNVVLNSSRMTGAYIGKKAYFSKRADDGVKTHEMTHYLQDINGVDRGAAASGNALKARKEAERQAYEVQKLTPYECKTLLGKWKQDIVDLAAAKEQQYSLKAGETK